jgi:uncharacterized protein (TIGR02231 family)
LEIRVEYIVPGACWRPHHTARLSSDKGSESVHFTTDGCVWQNSGEEWKNVALLFSTQRPSLGTEPPALSSDIVATHRREQKVVVETREQELTDTGLGAKPTGAPGTAAAADVPGIDDGGEALKLRGRHPATIPSDGRPWRVELFSFEAPARTEWTLMPELAASSVLKSLQSNGAQFPLLAGPVDLIRDSGYCGRTSILFIAPGEEFPLSWGPDSELRVHREHQKLDEEKTMLSAWISREHRISNRLSNIGAAPRQIILCERIPVSEIEKVQIAVDDKFTSEKKKPDANGFVKWTVKVEPFGHAAIELRYTVKRHKDVQGV